MVMHQSLNQTTARTMHQTVHRMESKVGGSLQREEYSQWHPPPLPNPEQSGISLRKGAQMMKTVPPAKPAHRFQGIITHEIATPREGNLRLGVSDNRTQNGCWIPSLIQNLHRIQSQHIKVQIFLVGQASLIQNLHCIHSQMIKVQIFLVGHVAKNLGGLPALE